jgi:hypothetical protein
MPRTIDNSINNLHPLSPLQQGNEHLWNAHYRELLRQLYLLPRTWTTYHQPHLMLYDRARRDLLVHQCNDPQDLDLHIYARARTWNLPSGTTKQILWPRPVPPLFMCSPYSYSYLILYMPTLSLPPFIHTTHTHTYIQTHTLKQSSNQAQICITKFSFVFRSWKVYYLLVVLPLYISFIHLYHSYSPSIPNPPFPLP